MRKLHRDYLKEPPVFFQRALAPPFILEDQLMGEFPVRRSPSPVCNYLNFQKRKMTPPKSKGVQRVKSVQEFKKQIKLPEIQQSEEKVRQRIKIMASSPLRSLYKQYCKSKKAMKSDYYYQTQRQRRSPANQKLSKKIDEIKLQLQPRLSKQSDGILLDHVLGRVHKILQQHQQRQTVWNQQKRQYLRKIRQLQDK